MDSRVLSETLLEQKGVDELSQKPAFSTSTLSKPVVATQAERTLDGQLPVKSASSAFNVLSPPSIPTKQKPKDEATPAEDLFEGYLMEDQFDGYLSAEEKPTPQPPKASVLLDTIKNVQKKSLKDNSIGKANTPPKGKEKHQMDANKKGDHACLHMHIYIYRSSQQYSSKDVCKWYDYWELQLTRSFF